MYFLNFDIWIQQLLPPSWRGLWPEALIKVFVHPFRRLHQELTQFVGDAPNRLNIQAQVMSLEFHLNLIAQTQREIHLSDNTQVRNGYFVHVPSDTDADTERKLRNFLDIYTPLGFQYELRPVV